MCGINGYLQFQPSLKKAAIIQLINEMNMCIYHRGPDADGCYADESTGIGMRRLSIIDVSSGNQPIYNEDGSLLIVMNGEVYNYKSLRQALIKKGHLFTTESDTEVVLHCYEEYGVDAVSMLDGMFALTIYNRKTKEIFLARDRSGEKPLYYYRSNNCFIFASEIKSLLVTGIIKQELCKEAMAQYFQLTYIPAPLTIFEGVYKLMPASYMRIGIDGSMHKRFYWELPYNSESLIADYSQCKKLLRESVFEAVERRMVSDVPLGTFLSGGIDSTVITAIASHFYDRPIDTYTIGFYDKNADESQKAALVAKKYGTNHHLHMLDYDDVFGQVDHILANMDEPFADSSLLATYMVARDAERSVKVILTGDAGDELFAGYSKYLIGYYSERYKKIPKWIRKGIVEPAWRYIPDKSPLTRKMGKVIRNAEKSLFEQRQSMMCLGFNEAELAALWGNTPERSLEFTRHYYETLKEADEITRAQYLDFKVVLEGDMFPKVDRASMLASVETRAPLMDPKVIETAYRIPSGFKTKNGALKVIFKDAFSDLIPDELMLAKKHGFSIPVDAWLRRELHSQFLQVTEPAFLEEQGLFNRDTILNIWEQHLRGRVNRGGELWAFFVFQKWYSRWFV